MTGLLRHGGIGQLDLFNSFLTFRGEAPPGGKKEGLWTAFMFFSSSASSASDLVFEY